MKSGHRCVKLCLRVSDVYRVPEAEVEVGTVVASPALGAAVVTVALFLEVVVLIVVVKQLYQ